MTAAHLARARVQSLAEGAPPSDDEASHLLECRDCRGAVSLAPELDAQLEALAMAPWPADDAATSDLLRRAAASRSTRSRRRAGAVVLALAAAAGIGWTALRGADPVAVDPAPGATVVRAREGADDVVTLDGAARFEVARLPAGRRFRVRAAGDHLEVKGTEFRVEATALGFSRVSVERGVVEVRPACCSAVTLRAGEAWARPAELAAPADPSESARSNVAPPVVSSAPASPAPAPPAPPERGATLTASELLAQGTAAYDAGRFSAASELLSRALAAEPSASWARDARVLAGAAQVLSSPPQAIPALPVSVASLDAAARRATSLGDGVRARAAAIGAARRSAGEGARRRWCALAADPAITPPVRDEASRACQRR